MYRALKMRYFATAVMGSVARTGTHTLLPSHIVSGHKFIHYSISLNKH